MLFTITTAILFSSELLEVKLEPNTTKKHPLQIKMTLTNISSHNLYIDKETFPFNSKDITRDIFKIKEDSKKIVYDGIISRGNPKYKLLAAGKSYTTYISLANFYLYHKGTHQYDIVYIDNISIKYKNISKLISLHSNHIEFKATIVKNKRSKSRKQKSRKLACPSNQYSTFSNDLLKARSTALKTIQLLQSSGYNHPLYKKYFGPSNSHYLNIVYENFKRIYNATFHVGMSCDQTYCNSTRRAYVHPNRITNKQINICPFYWTKTPNERQGTIIHELSHFYDIGHTTDDLYPGYGTKYEAASELARHTPLKAIRGAYNYGYYAEQVTTQGTSTSLSNKWTTGTYSNNQDIRKTLKISKGRRIKVRIDGELEAGRDFINIYNSKGQFLRQFTGVVHTSFTVKGKGIIAHLVTNGSVVKSGVTISIKRKKYWWEALCFWC